MALSSNVEETLTAAAITTVPASGWPPREPGAAGGGAGVAGRVLCRPPLPTAVTDTVGLRTSLATLSNQVISIHLYYEQNLGCGRTVNPSLAFDRSRMNGSQ